MEIKKQPTTKGKITPPNKGSDVKQFSCNQVNGIELYWLTSKYKNSMLIEKYTSNWIKNFTDIKAEIDQGLHKLDYSIEHVGSTAVPNLASKPIIDIDIIYANPAHWTEIKLCLEEIGYYHNGNQGIEDRDVFKRNGAQTNKILDTIKHHLYVCPAHSTALKRHLLSRDFLRKNDWARVKYQQMKYELAEKANQDRKKYAELKELNVNDFIDSIIKTYE